MKILISAGIYPPDVGGPANYAKQLNNELKKLDHTVEVARYALEKKLPTGVRHLFYFFKIIPKVIRSERILILDTFSVGLPTFLLAKILGKKIILRTGGDFIWELYVERTKKKVLLSEFYKPLPNDLSAKEKFLFWWIKTLLNGLNAIIFSTEFQRDIFIHGYGIDKNKTFIIENYYGSSEYKNLSTHLSAQAEIEKKPKNISENKVFLWAGRNIFLKNTNILKDIFKELEKEHKFVELKILKNLPIDEVLKNIKNSYAVILPSISEISPNFILESIMVKTPFITTKDTGLYNRIKDIGVFVDPKSKEDIKEKILFLAEDKNYLEIKNKLSNFSFTHTYTDIAKEFVEVFKKI